MSVRNQVLVWIALLAAGAGSLVWAYSYGGGAQPGLLDRAGPAVTWGLPAAKLMVNVAGACTIGTLVLAVFALPRPGTAVQRAHRLAAWSAVVWAGAAAAHTFANFLFIANGAPSTGAGAAFMTFLLEVDAGRSGALTALAAAAVAALSFRLRSPRMLVLTVVAAFAGLLPLVLRSHAAGGVDHADSTTAIFVHAATAAVWVGGLMALVALRPLLPGAELGPVVRRYSTLALICYIALVVSGILGALARINSIETLLSPYGVIILAKTGVFIILGMFGALHRRWSVNRIERNPARGGRFFAVLAGAELAVMGAASGMAAALARTEPPDSTGNADLVDPTAELEPALPLPEPGFWEYASRWDIDPLWSMICGFAVFAYLAGVRRLRAGGRSWPVHRTVLWLAGVAVLFLVTNGGVHVYQGYLFSAHVLTQMMLTAVVPLLLVPAAPLSLARLAVQARTDGSTGTREFLQRALQPLLKALRKDPILTIFILAASLYAIYFTPLLEWAAVGQIGYSAMTLLALLSGCLTIAALAGPPDTGSDRTGAKRLSVMAGLAALYAFCGWKLLDQARMMELPWYTSIGRPWGLSPAATAELGGPTMWSIAAVSLAITAIAIAGQDFTRRRSPELGQTGNKAAGSAHDKSTYAGSKA